MKIKCLPKFVTLLYLILCITYIYGYGQRVSQHCPENNLSYQGVTSIVADENKVLWFGTKNGLYYYDGIQFILADFSSTDDHVSTLLIHDQELYMGTPHGLKIFRPGNASKPAKQLLTQSPIYETQKIGDKIYITTNRMLCVIEHNDSLQTFELPDGFTPGEKINIAANSGNPNEIWLYNSSTLIAFNRDNQRFRKTEFANYKLPANESIKGIEHDNLGNIWFLTNKKLYQYNSHTHTTSVIISNPDEEFVRFDLLTDFKLIASTTEGNIHIYDILNNRHQKLDWQRAEQKNVIQTFYEDAQNNIWLGSHHNGVYFIDMIGNQFPFYQLTRPLNSIESEWRIIKVWTYQNKIYVGTKNNGIFQYIRERNSFNQVFTFKAQEPVLDYHMNHNETWGIQNNKLFIFSNNEQVIKTLHEAPDTVQFHKILYARNHILVIYTSNKNELGIMHYNPTLKTTNYQYITSINRSNPVVHDATIDKEGIIWFALAGEGLFSLTPDYNNGANTTINYKDVTRYSYKEHVQANVIYDLYVDRSEVLWIGTNNGLIKFNKFDKKFNNYHFHFQLPGDFSDITNIIEDNNNNLWLTTHDEIIRFNTRNEKYDLFESENNQIKPAFQPATHIQFNSHIIFGHKQGITLFEPEHVFYNKQTPTPYISQLQIENSDSLLTYQYPSLPEAITVNKNDEIRINLASSNYYQYNKNHFLYRIPNLHSKWQNVFNDNNTLHLTSLPSGTFNIEVKAVNNHGLVSDPSLVLQISKSREIPAYYYVIISLIVLVCIALYQIYRYRKTIAYLNRSNFLIKSKERGINNEYHLKTLVDLLPDILYIKDRESRFVFGNQQLAELMATNSVDKLIGKTDFEFFEKAYASQFFQDEQILMDKDQALINKTELITVDSKTDKWLLTSKIPIKNSKGHVIGLIGIGRDITLQKEAENRLIEQTNNLNETNTLLEEKQEEIRMQSEMLENEKNQLRALINNLPDLIYFKDTNAKFITGNTSLVHTLKVDSLEDVIGRDDYTFFPKEKADEFFADDMKVIQSGKSLDWKEESIFDDDGNEIIMTTTKIPIRDSENNIIGLVGIGRDITRLKETEDKLISQTEYLKEINTILEERQEEIRIQSESIEKDRNQLRGLIDNLPDLIYFKDTEARFVTANKALVTMAKANSYEEIAGKTDLDLFPREMAEQYYKDDINLIKTGKGIYNKEEKIIDLEGNERILSTTKVVIRDNENTIIGLIGIGRDITYLKETESQLRQQSNDLSELNVMLEERQEEVRVQSEKIETERNQLRTLIDNMPDRIYFKDSNARFIIANDTLINNFKLDSIDQLIGKTDFDFYPRHAAEKFYADDMEIIKSGEPLINKEETGYDRDGNERYVSTTKVPIKDADGQVVGLIGIGRDITKQKLAEKKLIEQSENLKETNQLLEERQEEIQQQSEELHAQAENLQEANSELQRLNKTKDKFFSIIAHDLKNPFHAIMGFSELLTKEFTKMDDSQKLGLIDLINVSSESAFNLLENLLQWARTQTDKIKFYPEDIDLSDLVESNIKFHKVSALKKKIKLESKVSVDTLIHADSNMINTVLRNLISNAIKFTDNDGKITISADKMNDMIEVKVTDTGIGIDPETIDKLFRIDTYHTSIGTSGESGTGLGLIISREFIAKHEGKMNVTSKPGKGSTFSFTVPAGKA